MAYHQLLLRQLKKANIDLGNSSIAPEFVALLERVSRSYHEADQDRYILEQAIDISSQEMQELRQRLEKEQVYMQAIISEGLCTIDHHWLITSINTEASRLFNCKPNEVKGKHFFDVMHLYQELNNPHSEIVVETIEYLLDTGKIPHFSNCFIQSPEDNHSTPVTISFNPLAPSTAKFNGAVIVLTDKSERTDNPYL